jgi:putative ABC transport system substrate-binding protein
VFRTVVNQRAAQAAGLSIPDDVARQANIVNR